MSHLDKLAYYKEIITYLIVIIAGFSFAYILIIGTIKKWEFIVDPPEELWLFYSNAALKKFFGKEVLIPINYFFGAMALCMGVLGIYKILEIIIGF